MQHQQKLCATEMLANDQCSFQTPNRGQGITGHDTQIKSCMQESMLTQICVLTIGGDVFNSAWHTDEGTFLASESFSLLSGLNKTKS